MPYKEFDYIEICKKQLEHKFSFGNGQGYTQKDLELLSNYIEEEIGVSISLSTLKRLWKNNFKHGPQLATLNALANVLGYEGWQHFKLENKKKDLSSEGFSKDTTHSNQKKSVAKILLIVIGLVVCSTAVISFIEKKKIDVHGPVVFEADKTVTKGTPNTVIFNYDVSNVKADSFFIQQSWNVSRRKKIDPDQKVFTDIYYEAGYHKAKLYANDTIIAKQPIHILSDGWEPQVYYEESDERYIHFKGSSYINDGQLHIPLSLLRKAGIDSTRAFFTRVNHSQKYNVSSDNFSYFTRVKLDVDLLEGRNCPIAMVSIVTEEHIFFVRLTAKGCEKYGRYKLGEIYRDGENNDLSLLGRNIFEWQKVDIRVKDKEAQIFVNDTLIYTEKFKKDFGDIVGLFYIFEGTGYIDYVNLTDEKGNIAFEDDFEY